MNATDSTGIFHPPAPATLEQAGLKSDVVEQLVLKLLYFSGELTGAEMTRRLGLGFSVFEPCLEFLKQQRLVEVTGASVFGGASFRYRTTDAGRMWAAGVLKQNQYVGVAPVPLEQYRRYILDFKKTVPLRADRDSVRTAFSDMVVSDAVLDAVGPAVNFGHSMFVYGAPGNGKTMMAHAIRGLLAGNIAIPHAIEVEGNIIKVFDPACHEELPLHYDDEKLARGVPYDRRWAHCRRPIVTVGGELTLDALDLRYNAINKLYRAPGQLAANGGVLVIDDFGRQRCSPRDLLNRWIGPLESRIDFLTLQSGQTIEIPFIVLLVLSTNLKPTELADEAFLRRIRYKIFAESPTRGDFIRIFENYCKTREIPFERHVVEYMLDDYYRPNKIPLRGCQPRDLITQALTLAAYLGQPARLTPELMDAACRSYFVHDRELPATYA
ncbi:MAG: AAA family ATPase [Acidobacteria bacterium]|nr:MAG: AAA family ATPase [Acidobacteriota bacterium]